MLTFYLCIFCAFLRVIFLVLSNVNRDINCGFGFKKLSWVGILRGRFWEIFILQRNVLGFYNLPLSQRPAGL